ncbi:MAG TPA: four helix bundle protein [Segetibacter sp.]|jgi:four helix bundle protein
MKENNLIVEKSYAFALRIVKLYWYMIENRREYKLSGQLLSSGTSIGANVEEAMGGSSRKDFKYKLEISYREARETKYWLRLLRDSDFLEKRLSESLLEDCEEILKILGSILKTLKNNPNPNP